VKARIALLLMLCAALATPAPAAAQQSPFGPIPQAPPEPAPAPAPADEDEGLSDTQQLLIGLAGLVLVGGIAFAILRDARRAAPQGESHSALDSEGRHVKGTRKPPKQRVEQSRAKAKTARQARKRNR
jgi:hypothetical protein